MPFFSFKTVDGDTAVLKVAVVDETSNVSVLNTYQGTVTTSSAQLVADNPNRVSIVIRNLSATATIYLKSGPGAAIAVDYPIPPNSESPPIAYKGAIYAIASTGTADARALEQAVA